MKCKRCANPIQPVLNFETLDTTDDLHILCHKCYVAFNTALANRKRLGEIMRQHLPLNMQRRIISERRLDYARSEVPTCR